MTARKAYVAGTHRTVAPAATVARMRPMFSTFGITRVADVTGLDRIGIPVTMVCRPNARSLSVAQGKGHDRDAAQASGIMEAIELWHAEHVDLPLRRGSCREMADQARIVDIHRLARSRDRALDLDRPILWIAGRGARSAEPVLVPYEAVDSDARLPHAGEGMFSSSSNGLASGNVPAEAISHALCELIERDATALWDAGGEDARRATLLDLDTVDDPGCVTLIEQCRRAGLTVLAWDQTSDVGIAAIAVLLLDPVADRLHYQATAMGMGCHPAREVALSRAITEAAQSRLTVITGARDDLLWEDYVDTHATEAALTDYAATAVIPASARRPFTEVTTRTSDDVDDDVGTLLERLAAVGVGEPVVVDLTRPAYGIPVVKVVAAGLEGPHSSPDYLPGPRAAARRAR